MQYDDFVFPNEPETLHVTFRRDYAVAATEEGSWTVEDRARLGRIVEGEGAFCGEKAYETFSTLAKYLFLSQPRVLRHPKWEAFRAYLVKLESIESGCEDCVRYRFTFLESPQYV